MKSWFLQVTDKTKMQCIDELSTVKFVPQLNMKETEETHQDYQKLKDKKEAEVDPYYFNILEELTDFNDWCISDDNKWGIPIPFFKEKNSDKLLID